MTRQCLHMRPDPPPSPAAQPATPIWPVVAIAILIVLPEVILIAADQGIIGTRRWRSLAYTYGAFWTGLLTDWQANYPGQPGIMFASYSILHAGLGHLAGNLAALIWLGPIALTRLRPLAFFELYALSVLGGAIGFGLLSTAFAPMVGASGAIFGLAGAWLVWAFQDQPKGRPAQVFALKMVALVIALNAGIWVLQDGLLAWETHLGGFVAGALAAMVLPRKDRR